MEEVTKASNNLPFDEKRIKGDVPIKSNPKKARLPSTSPHLFHSLLINNPIATHFTINF